MQKHSIIHKFELWKLIIVSIKQRECLQMIMVLLLDTPTHFYKIAQ